MDHLDRSNLLTQLKEATFYFSQKSPQYNQLIKMEEAAIELTKAFESHKKLSFSNLGNFFLAIFITSATLFTISFYLYMDYQYTSNFLLFTILDIPLILVFYFILQSSKKRKLEKCTQKLDKLNNEKNRLLTDLYQNYQNFRYPNLLPFKYTFPGFIEILYEYINDHRANTITEAINLYHDEIHKQNIEKSQKEIIRISKANNSSTRRAGNWAAAATAISVLGLFVKR
jgi:hypothetical protein